MMDDWSQVVFLCGDKGLGSCQVRGFDIAPRISTGMACPAPPLEKIVPHYRVFIFVKANYPPGDLEKLARRKRARLIWDVIDDPPPVHAPVDIYLASTKLAAEQLAGRGRVEVIPHHHCNVNRVLPKPSDKLVYIGIQRWCPTPEEAGSIEFIARYTDGLDSDSTALLYRDAGILFNLRKRNDELWECHRHWSSGIKLINSIGFGIPSISSDDEPVYHEIDEQAGGGCTLFVSTPEQVAAALEKLKDGAVYRQMQERCLAAADRWHVNVIASQYIRLIRGL